MKKQIFAAVMTLTLLLGLAVPASAEAITHGTSNQWVQDNMVRNTPPVDYTIDESVQADAMEGKYNAYFLDTQLQEVRIEIDEMNLNYLLQHATEENYVMTNAVTIGDTTVGYCGLRTKGNYTLWHSYTDNPGSDRFSFTINFGKYITKADYGKKQNFYGCEKISFNNFFFDKSMMKEFFAFKLMEEMGLPTPQYGLAKLYINGAYYGVYFMVEAMDETVLEQYWNVDSKELSSYLCKPTGTKFNYGDLVKDSSPLWEYDEETHADVQDMLPTVLEWVNKLNQLNSGKDFDGNAIDVQSEEYIELLSSVMDLEEVVKYFAVASWLCQMDNMFTNLQNYALYISQEGVASMLPWDYDLAFGCYYPSSAETTANYPIDVMYQLDQRQYDQEEAVSARFYANFPLFNVIYQNDSLMEQYHSYMAECSQIAALGGTVASTGKSYDPGYFDSYIEIMQDDLIAAATEETADNVYYMNGINQPKNVEKALPNLSKIIAQRSVGVWAQVNGIDTTVSSAGCDLATLGNAVTGEFSNTGILTIVDSGTGIFATAEYAGNRRAVPPALTLTELAAGNESYEQIKDRLSVKEKDTLLVYDSYVSAQAISEYTLTVPLAQEYLEEDTEISFYTYGNEELTAIEMTREGNLFTGTAAKLGTIVVHVQPAADYTLWIIIAAAGLLTAGAVAFLLIRKKRKSIP